MSTAAPQTVLCVNAGSSSLKIALFEVSDAGERRIAAGAASEIGGEGSRFVLRGEGGETRFEGDSVASSHAAAVRMAFDALAAAHLPAPDAVGHRLVHGGPSHVAPARIDAPLLASLRKLVALAPLHLPAAIDGIEAVLARYPGLPQVACFDTAFHHAMPEVARRLPLPAHLAGGALRRFGFHGLSYEYAVATLGAKALGRAVIAHLGNGASLAAVKDGAPIDTSMGFSPTGGVPMGTRSGDLDPGVLVYLLDHEHLGPERVAHLVEREAGLLGVSETTSDMRELLERRDADPRAALAVALFTYQIRKTVGAFAAALGGLDTLVFTGGIGEHAAPVRAEICEGLAHLGVRLDPARNAAAHGDAVIGDGACTVRVLTTDEDRMIARHTRRALS